MEFADKKHMVIVGYGDIGSAIGKIAKHGLGMKVTGLKRRPDQVNDAQKNNANDIVGNDQYDRVIAEADYVVGVLPGLDSTIDFFNMESTFKKMKKTAVFMNIGRGSTVNEQDLVEALNTEVIGGGVLDVFKKEPLVVESGLWECKNLLITPHCADQDAGHIPRSLQVFEKNLEIYMEKGEKELVNVCDKQAGY